MVDKQTNRLLTNKREVMSCYYVVFVFRGCCSDHTKRRERRSFPCRMQYTGVGKQIVRDMSPRSPLPSLFRCFAVSLFRCMLFSKFLEWERNSFLQRTTMTCCAECNSGPCLLQDYSFYSPPIHMKSCRRCG